jgi:7tm Chemosensory receptor
MFFFRLFGLNLLGNDFKPCRIFRFINLSWMIINIAIFSFLVFVSGIFTNNYSQMSDIIEKANYTFALATNLIISVHVQLVMAKDVKWHKMMNQLDCQLRDKYHVKINRGSKAIWKIVITLVGSVACCAINVHYAMKNADAVLLPVVHNYFLKTIINLRYIQNLTRIDVITAHIVGVHEAIQKTVEHNTVKWKMVLVTDAFQRHYQEPVQKIDDASDILMFKKFYGTLFASVKLLENIFGWSLLAMISFTFIDLTSNLYWFFLAFLGLHQQMFTVDCVFEIIPSVLIFNCLIYSSFNASRKVKEVVNSVTKLYTNTTSWYNKLIKEFLMQIHHEKIENSANDFFIVDFQLFSAVSWRWSEMKIN